MQRSTSECAFRHDRRDQYLLRPKLQARSTRHLLATLKEFNHLGKRFVSVQDQIDTDSPMGRAMFTIIGAMAERARHRCGYHSCPNGR